MIEAHKKGKEFLKQAKRRELDLEPSRAYDKFLDAMTERWLETNSDWYPNKEYRTRFKIVKDVHIRDLFYD
jgi:hypothetical protein